MVYQPRSKGFRSYRPRCRRKLRLNQPSASTPCGTKSAGRMSWRKPTGAAAPTRARRAWTARRSTRSTPMGRSDGWKRCGRSWAGRTGPSPCCAYGYRRATAASARSASRASATAWSRWRCCWCIGPIFEADLLRSSTASVRGWTPRWRFAGSSGTSRDRGRREVVDADLSDYFTSIPHGPLMRCLSRRIADGTLLSRHQELAHGTGGGAGPTGDRCRRPRRDGPTAGDPAGRRRSRPCWRTSTSVASCWPGSNYGHRDQLDAHVVNYADDFVICCRPGNAEAAMARCGS